MVAWYWPRWEYLHNRHWQMRQNQGFLFPEQVVKYEWICGCSYTSPQLDNLLAWLKTSHSTPPTPVWALWRPVKKAKWDLAATPDSSSRTDPQWSQASGKQNFGSHLIQIVTAILDIKVDFIPKILSKCLRKKSTLYFYFNFLEKQSLSHFEMILAFLSSLS